MANLPVLFINQASLVPLGLSSVKSAAGEDWIKYRVQWQGEISTFCTVRTLRDIILEMQKKLPSSPGFMPGVHCCNVLARYYCNHPDATLGRTWTGTMLSNDGGFGEGVFEEWSLVFVEAFVTDPTLVHQYLCLTPGFGENGFGDFTEMDVDGDSDSIGQGEENETLTDSDMEICDTCEEDSNMVLQGSGSMIWAPQPAMG